MKVRQWLVQVSPDGSIGIGPDERYFKRVLVIEAEPTLALMKQMAQVIINYKTYIDCEYPQGNSKTETGVLAAYEQFMKELGE